MLSQAIDRLMSLTVADVMNHPVIPIESAAPMAHVAKVMVEHDISGLPVIDDQGRCLGILSATTFVDREAACNRASGGPCAGEPHGLSRENRGRPLSIEPMVSDRAAEYMTRGLQTVSPDAPLISAARMMCNQHIHRLPVLDADDRPVGMITATDIIAALVTAIDEATQ